MCPDAVPSHTPWEGGGGGGGRRQKAGVGSLGGFDSTNYHVASPGG